MRGRLIDVTISINEMSVANFFFLFYKMEKHLLNVDVESSIVAGHVKLK